MISVLLILLQTQNQKVWHFVHWFKKRLNTFPRITLQNGLNNHMATQNHSYRSHKSQAMIVPQWQPKQFPTNDSPHSYPHFPISILPMLHREQLAMDTNPRCFLLPGSSDFPYSTRQPMLQFLSTALPFLSVVGRSVLSESFPTPTPAPACQYDSNYHPQLEKIEEAHKAARFAEGGDGFWWFLLQWTIWISLLSFLRAYQQISSYNLDDLDGDGIDVLIWTLMSEELAVSL